MALLVDTPSPPLWPCSQTPCDFPSWSGRRLRCGADGTWRYVVDEGKGANSGGSGREGNWHPCEEPVQSGSKTSHPDSLNAHDAAYETSMGGSVLGLVTDHM